MQKITHRGDEIYNGFDQGTTLTIQPGETVEVTPGKAAQLVADFPDRFTTDRPSRPPAKPASTDKPKRTGERQSRTTSR